MVRWLVERKVHLDEQAIQTLILTETVYVKDVVGDWMYQIRDQDVTEIIVITKIDDTTKTDD